jgi:hypothetical protein
MEEAKASGRSLRPPSARIPRLAETMQASAEASSRHSTRSQRPWAVSREYGESGQLLKLDVSLAKARRSRSYSRRHAGSCSNRVSSRRRRCMHRAQVLQPYPLAISTPALVHWKGLTPDFRLPDSNLPGRCGHPQQEDVHIQAPLIDGKFSLHQHLEYGQVSEGAVRTPHFGLIPQTDSPREPCRIHGDD